MLTWLLSVHMFDWWTLAHIATWALFVQVLEDHFDKWTPTFISCSVFGLSLGVCWELIELFAVEPLLGFHEPPWNRWCGDLLADMAGTWLWWCDFGRCREES